MASSDTSDYALWLTDEKRDRLLRMASALRNDLQRMDGIGPEMRLVALGHVTRWIEEADASKKEGATV